jgi:hypothetical protein
MAIRSTFSLIAAADTLIVDLEAGERFAITQLNYTKDPEWVILHRLDGDDWIPIPLLITGPTDPVKARGSFTSLAVRPGHTYQACIVPPDFHPDASHQPYSLTVPYDHEEGPPAFASIVALRKRPEVRDFYSDGNSRTYGTYHERDVVAKQTVHAQFTVGSNKPVDLGDGRYTLPAPHAVQVRGPGQTFAFRVAELLPGTEYHTLLLLLDDFGNWQFLSEQVTTQQRKVDVKLEAVFIVDDGDDFSTGEGDFKFYLYTSGPADQTSNTVKYSNSNLDSGKFVSPPPSGTCTLGPYAATPDTAKAFFFTLSFQDNTGSLEGDDLAMGMREIPCPSGPGETVTNVSDSVTAVDPVGEEYEYRVDYRYTVSYL